jgi:diamine N-acetyltransferase
MSFNPTAIYSPDGTQYTIRLLGNDDAERLGEYFDGLSAETRRRYGPHPMNRASAAELCKQLNPLEVVRFVILDQDQIIGYMILEMRVSPDETSRYVAQGILLDSARDCTFAPSMADAYQNRGIGTPAAQQVIAFARLQGRRFMVLMGGTQATNARGIHFYRKLGFQHISDFEKPPGAFNHDMKLDL